MTLLLERGRMNLLHVLQLPGKKYTDVMQRPVAVGFMINEHPFPNEPADISRDERIALWLSVACLEDSLPQDMKKITSQMGRLDIIFGIGLFVPFFTEVHMIWLQYAPWKVFVVSAILLVAAIAGLLEIDRMSSDKEKLLDTLKSPSWSHLVVEATWSQSSRSMASKHIISFWRSIGGRNPATIAVRWATLSVADQVGLMRLGRMWNAEKLENVVLDGDAKELIGRAMSVLDARA